MTHILNTSEPMATDFANTRNNIISNCKTLLHINNNSPIRKGYNSLKSTNSDPWDWIVLRNLTVMGLLTCNFKMKKVCHSTFCLLP